LLTLEALMAATRISLANIKVFAAEKADMLETVGGSLAVSGFVNDVTLLAWVNGELAALWDHLILSGEDYAVKTEPIHLQPNIEAYPLPKDFYKFRKVFPMQSGERGVALKKFNVDSLGRDVSIPYVTASRVHETRYRIRGNRIMFHPRPSSAAEVELWYYPMFSPLEQDQEEINQVFPIGWEDYVTEGVAARMLEKEESDSSKCVARQEKILIRILQLIEDRDVGEPHSMQDTEGYLDDYYLE
jgi:hypothetical protein